MEMVKKYGSSSKQSKEMEAPSLKRVLFTGRTTKIIVKRRLFLHLMI